MYLLVQADSESRVNTTDDCIQCILNHNIAKQAIEAEKYGNIMMPNIIGTKYYMQNMYSLH